MPSYFQEGRLISEWWCFFDCKNEEVAKNGEVNKFNVAGDTGIRSKPHHSHLPNQ